MRRFVLVFVVFGVVGCDFVQSLMGSAPEEPGRGASSARSLAPAEAGLLDAPTPAAVLEHMKARTRLEPDRRFTAALTRLDALVGKAAPASPAAVVFEAGAWRVQVGEEPASTVSELPAFPELFETVRSRADRVWKASGLQLAAGASHGDANRLLTPDEIVPVLNALGVAWTKGERVSSDLERGAQAGVLLAVSLVDYVGVGDEVASHAIALLAFAEAAIGKPLIRERALLARALEYQSSAVVIAKELDDDDPVRLYAQDEIRKLNASDDPASSMLAASSALGVASHDDRQALVAAMMKRESVSFPEAAVLAAPPRVMPFAYLVALSSTLALREITKKPVQLPAGLKQVGGNMIQGAADDLDAITTALALPLAAVLPTTERLLAEARALPSGPFLPSSVQASFYAAQFMSALHTIVRFQLDTRNDAQGAEASIDFLGAPESPLGKQFEQYVRDITRAERRTLKLDALVKDIGGLDQLGVGALRRITTAVLEQGSYTRDLERAESALYRRCDSRVDCRALLESVAYRGTRDAAASEQLRASIAAEAPTLNSEVRLRQAFMTHDRLVMLSALGDRSVDVANRAWYLGNWSEWLEPSEVKRAFDGLLAEAPYDHDVREHYGRYLTDHGEQQAAIEVFDVYLKLDPKMDAHPLHRLGIRAQKARALQELGKLSEARELVEPDVDTMYGASLGRTALVMSAQGEHDAAIAMAQRRLERYPDTGSIALACEVLWRAGKDDEAAALLKQSSSKLTIDDWHREISKAFADTFKDAPAERVAAAYLPITKQSVDSVGLRSMILGADLPAEHRFRAYMQLPGRGYQKHIDAGRLYNFMKQWQGEPEARAYIEKYLPAGQRDPFAQHGYTAGNYELIWTFVPDLPEDHAHVAFLWLMRTASYLRTKERPTEWKAKLDARYADGPAAHPHPHDQMAMFLLDKIDADALWRASAGADHRPEAAWVLGLKADVSGDLTTAIHWYRATVQAGRGNSGEVQWATSSLSRWRDARKSLAVLATDLQGDGIRN